LDIYLHHYPASLFSEKIRALLGYFGLTWHSVEIPNIMPRPLTMPLSGGYRRTPILQVGANVYCDTKIIAKGLARLASDDRLYREGFVAHRVADWADTHLFQVVVALNFQPAAVASLMKDLSMEDITAFQKDRAELAQGASIVGFSADVALGFLHHALGELDRRLEDRFLFGDEPTIADFSVYHCLWFLNQNEVNAPLLRSYLRVGDWMEAIAGFGHGTVCESSGEAALSGAKAQDPVDPGIGCGDDLELGAEVAVTPVDYGKVPVHGSLVGHDPDEIVIARQAPEVGSVMNHFPSPGFELRRAD